MAGEMDLADGRGRQRVQVGDRIEPEVPGDDTDVVHVAEDPAARATGDLGQELDLRDVGGREADVARRVLDQQPAPERRLCLVDVAAEQVEARIGVGHRQEVVEVGPADRAPGEVLRDEHGLNEVDQRPEPREVVAVESVGAAEGQGDPVQADRIVAAQIEQVVEGRRGAVPDRGGRHVVLGMDLKEADLGGARPRSHRRGAPGVRSRPAPGGRDTGGRRCACSRPPLSVSGQAFFRLAPSIFSQVPTGT
jgi:hypothetical protein